MNRCLSTRICPVKEDYCACMAADVTAREVQRREYKTQLMHCRTRETAGVFPVRMDEEFALLCGSDRYSAMLGYAAESMGERLNNKCIACLYG